MKKKVWISIVALVTISLLVLVLWAFHAVQQPEKLTIAVQPVKQINYNNYYENTRLDYRGEQLAWQRGNKLTVLDDDGNTSGLSGIPSPFQLLEDRVVYLKNDDLMCRMRTGGTEEYLASGVVSFIALDDGVLYLSDGTLRRYTWDEQRTTLGYGLEAFFYHKETIYAVTSNRWMVELRADGTWREIYEFEELSLPMVLKFQNGYAIHQFGNELHYIALKDGTLRTLVLAEGEEVNNRIRYICDESRLFLSYQATETDGSIVTDVEDEKNGVWQISTAGEETKLTDEVFEQLYLFEGNRLFGVRENDLFQIDTESGIVTQITE